MAKYGVYFTWFHWPFVTTAIYETLLKKTNPEDEVVIFTCKKMNLPCHINTEMDTSICDSCYFQKGVVVENLRKELSKKSVKLIEHEISRNSENEKEAKEILLKFGKIQNSIDLFDLCVDQCKIGYGILSTYFSITRNINPVISEKFINFISNSLYLNLNILRNISRNYVPYDDFFLFNGRGIDTRVVKDFCTSKSQKINIVENVLIEGDSYNIEYLGEYLPQDIEYRSLQIEQTWGTSELKEEEKVNIGSSYFEERRNGNSTTRDKIFNETWRQDFVPNIGINKRNILVLISSEDEGLAIPEILHLNLFKSQLEGVRFILDNLSNELFHFIIRIHPNLKNVKYKYHLDLLNLTTQYSNTEIISAESNINTYSIFNFSEKVVCFGSTAGIEASYFGLPVINCSATYYYNIDAVYNPKDKSKLIELIEEKILKAKPKVNAIKFGFYMKTPHLYSQENETILNKNKLLNFQYYKFQKILHSPILFKIILKLKNLVSSINKSKISLELKEKVS